MGHFGRRNGSVQPVPVAFHSSAVALRLRVRREHPPDVSTRPQLHDVGNVRPRSDRQPRCQSHAVASTTSLEVAPTASATFLPCSCYYLFSVLNSGLLFYVVSFWLWLRHRGPYARIPAVAEFLFLGSCDHELWLMTLGLIGPEWTSMSSI